MKYIFQMIRGVLISFFFKVIDDEKKTQELEAEKNGEKHKKPVDAPYPEGVKKDQVPTVRKRWFTDRDSNGTVDQTDLMMGKCNQGKRRSPRGEG